MNLNAVDGTAGKRKKKHVKTALVPEHSKVENTSDRKKIVAPEEKEVNSGPQFREKTPSVKEAPAEEKTKETNIAKQTVVRPEHHIVETDLLPPQRNEDLSSENDDKTPHAESNSKTKEKERDAMDEALFLLDESHNCWIKGDLDDALQMLDQAYALLLDTDGNPEIARQKDDLRLIIAKKILTIYNSIQSPTKGIRGEIPLTSNADVEKEIRAFQTFERNFFISSYQRSLIYRPLISNELKKAGLPDELSWLPLVESGYKITALSPARALGLWQFIPSTGYKYGLNRDYWIDERMDIEKSTKAAIAYLKDLHAMFGDWLTVLAAYNCGEGRVIKTISSQHINYLDRFWDLYQRLPNETARYVPRFLATLLIVKNPQKYGFDLTPKHDTYVLPDYDTVETTRSIRLSDIAAKLKTSSENLYLLNAELRHKRTPDKPYQLKVPEGKGEKFLQIVAAIPSAKISRISHKSMHGAFITHKVRRGETLGSIAIKYNTSVNLICAANAISKKSLLAVGKRLRIPYSKRTIPASRVSFHKVRGGDSLSRISHKYGISVTELKKINNLKSSRIKIGQVLRIRPQNRKYKVRKGDNLSLIAQKNGISIKTLLQLNNISRHDHIYPGQEIRIR